MDARTFIDALRAIEERADVEPMAALYAADAELRNPTRHEPHRGPDGAREFWSTYRGSFDEIRSDFRCIVEGEGAAMLEWTSSGRVTGGVPFRYDGVTVIEWEGDRLRRFRAYFDPSELTPPMSEAAHDAAAARG